MKRLFEQQGDRQLYELARAVEACALRLLREHKPTRALQTNVEFYTALVLHGLEFPTTLFTPAFAAARVAGWTAHCLEQIAANRLFRPQSTYIGEHNRTWPGSRGSDRTESQGTHAIGNPTTVAGCPSTCTPVPGEVKSRWT